MAINRSSIGKQLSDLGSYIGRRNLQEQFSPQRLANGGQTVAESLVTYKEPDRFGHPDLDPTRNYAGRTYQYNPDKWDKPGPGGYQRVNPDYARLKGLADKVASEGGVQFFRQAPVLFEGDLPPPILEETETIEESGGPWGGDEEGFMGPRGPNTTIQQQRDSLISGKYASKAPYIGSIIGFLEELHMPETVLETQGILEAAGRPDLAAKLNEKSTREEQLSILKEASEQEPKSVQEQAKADTLAAQRTKDKLGLRDLAEAMYKRARTRGELEEARAEIAALDRSVEAAGLNAKFNLQGENAIGEEDYSPGIDAFLSLTQGLANLTGSSQTLRIGGYSRTSVDQPFEYYDRQEKADPGKQIEVTPDQYKWNEGLYTPPDPTDPDPDEKQDKPEDPSPDEKQDKPADPGAIMAAIDAAKRDADENLTAPPGPDPSTLGITSPDAKIDSPTATPEDVTNGGDGGGDSVDGPAEDGSFGFGSMDADGGGLYGYGGAINFKKGGGLSSLKPQFKGQLNPGDFVLSADVVSGIGDGSSEAGVKRITKELAITPFKAAYGGEVRGVGSGLDDLVQTTIKGGRAARLSNQEFVVPKQDVLKIGNGSLRKGQEMLYKLMGNVRNQKSGGKQPSELQGSLSALMNKA